MPTISVASLRIPDFRGEGCDYARITLSAVLSPAELKDLQAIWGDSTDINALTVRSAGSGKERTLLRQHLFVHQVEPAEAVEEAATMRENDPAYPSADQIAAHLQLELVFAVGDDESDTDDVDELAQVEASVNWLRTTRRDLEVTVFAGRTFDASRYDPVVEMPEAPRPFTATRGVTLVRESDEPLPGSVVYEVHIRKSSDLVPVSAYYRTKLAGGDDAIERIVQQATEITEFGVRRRLVTGDYVASS